MIKRLKPGASRAGGLLLGLSLLAVWMVMSLPGQAMRVAKAGAGYLHGESAAEDQSHSGRGRHKNEQAAGATGAPSLSIRDIKILRAGLLPSTRFGGDMTSIGISSDGWQPGETVKISIYKPGASIPDATFNITADEEGKLSNTKLMLFNAASGARQMTATGQGSERSVTSKFRIHSIGDTFVNTYDSTCMTFQTSFVLGDTVCAQVTGSIPEDVTARFDWIDPDGIVQEMGPTIVAIGQTDTFVIPAMGPNAKLGTWKVQITDASNNAELTSQSFTVTSGGPQPETIQTLDSSCEDPQSSFSAGFTACARVTGINAGDENLYRIDWIRPDSTVAEMGPVVTMDGQTDTFAIPASGPEGSWTVRLIKISDSSTQAEATFFVTVLPCEVFCTENVTTSNDPGQCGANVNYNPPFTQGDCGTTQCTPSPGSFFPVGTTTVTCDVSGTMANPDCTFTITVNDTEAPAISCPNNISVNSPPDQCQATVNYSVPTATDNCSCVGMMSGAAPQGNGSCPVTCEPASGGSFPVGTTTVTCMSTDASNNTASCSFTITVNDGQPPSITCPSNVTVVTAPSCPPASGAAVNYTTPVATDNCKGAMVMCSPASGSTFPAGVTTVTCTATDASGNTASCSFTVGVFNGCLQDDSNSSNVVLFNTATGDYRYCCNGVVIKAGRGTVTPQGCNYTIAHNTTDRRVTIQVSFTTKNGSASLQAPPGANQCRITDRNITNNTTCASCGAPVIK